MVMESDFAFAFNDPMFSDRLLRIEITGGGGEVSCSSISDGVRDHKRRRLDCNNVLDLDTCHVELDLNKKEAILTATDESKSGYEDEKLTPTTSVLRVKELHISSLMLAAKSHFFFKLFSNGMLESGQRDVTLSIDFSEEAAVMELLNFMYTNSLSVTTTPALLHVLMVADKYEVASCMEYCSHSLLNTPMTVESALLFLDLPSSVVTAVSVKPLMNAARQFLASHYKDIFKFPMEEIMALPLVGLEAILASDGLKIKSEDSLYNIVLKWAKSHYSDLKQRQEIFGSRLARYIRFPHMTCRKLKKILTSKDFRPAVASSLVLEALFFKAESMQSQRGLATKRVYKHRPIQIVKFEAPLHQCFVYLDLTREECVALYPSGRVYSQPFQLGRHEFVLYATCNLDRTNSFRCFGLFLRKEETLPESPTVDFKFSARSKPTEEFVGKGKLSSKFTASITPCSGKSNLFSIPWESFMSKECPYFISDILHLRAKLSIRH